MLASVSLNPCILFVTCSFLVLYFAVTAHSLPVATEVDPLEDEDDDEEDSAESQDNDEDDSDEDDDDDFEDDDDDDDDDDEDD